MKGWMHSGLPIVVTFQMKHVKVRHRRDTTRWPRKQWSTVENDRGEDRVVPEVAELRAAALSAVGGLRGEAAVAGLAARVARVARQADLRGALQLCHDAGAVPCSTKQVTVRYRQTRMHRQVRERYIQTDEARARYRHSWETEPDTRTVTRRVSVTGPASHSRHCGTPSRVAQWSALSQPAGHSGRVMTPRPHTE